MKQGETMKTKITALFVALMILIVSTGAVSAFNYVGKEYVGTMCKDVRAQSITLPSAAYLPTAEFKCTGEMDACVWVFKDHNLNVVGEVPIMPGGVAKAPVTSYFAEVYYCYEGVPSCGDWTNKACGGTGGGAICSKTEILQSRECQKSVMYGGDKYTEGKCVSTMQCTAPTCTPSVGAWSSCSNSKQTRTITYADCGKTTETQSCTIQCSNPTGSPGQTRFSSGCNYVCNGLSGKWDKGSCLDDDDNSGSGSDSGSNGGTTGDNSGGTTGGTTGGNTNTASPNIVLVSSAATYDEAKGMVMGRAVVKNTGGDMKETYLFEMQVKQKGKFLATVSEQKVCDTTHPENVHKLYALNSGEEAAIDFYVPNTQIKDGEYEIYFLTAKKCYKDLTSAEALNNANYVGPLPDGKKIATVTIGNDDANPVMKFAPFLVMLAGIVLAALFRSMPTTIIGIGMFIAGALWWLWSLFRGWFWSLFM